MNEVNHALQKIARGTGIVFAGTIISMFFEFLGITVMASFFQSRIRRFQSSIERL